MTVRRSSHLHTLIALAALTLGGLTSACASAAATPASSAVTRPAPPPASAASDAVVELTILQMNDVYEIQALSGGAEGGLARVASLKHELARRNPNTFAVLAGDVFSPSALGTARVDGQRLNGRQIVDVMNAAGLDYATFGNHEFDIPRADFLARLSESSTTWFSSNVRDSNGQPFPQVPSDVIFTVTNREGRTARIGMFGLTKLPTAAGQVQERMSDPLAAARTEVARLRPRVDVLIAVTHLALADDVAMVEQVPGIDLVVGGHEHQNVLVRRGRDLTPIAKADSNARTVYVHDVAVDTSSHAVQVSSALRHLGADVAENPAVAARAQGWIDKAFAAFRTQGFEPGRLITTTTEPLDGLEASVRHHPTRLTDLVALGMLHHVPGAEWAILNSGGVRIEDVIQPGPLSEYDLIRILPFGNNVVAIDMKGSLLQKVLAQGAANEGNGGFLATARTGNGTIDPDRTYLVAIVDFLLTGGETGLGYLTREHPELKMHPGLAPEVDVRIALKAELLRTYPPPAAPAPTPR